MTKPKYSICISNYNMGDTIERSLRSIMDQLNCDFEVVLVDDGSSDESVSIVKELQKEYKSLRLITLERDKNRKLGFTRNVSISEARGEYVLLHLDCDDIYDPYLIDFTKVFHKIEKATGRDILLSGEHVNMGKRDFLLSHGPYRNIFRGEDRDMWVRLASVESLFLLKHVDFVTRLPKKMQQKFKRSIINTWDHLENDFRFGATFVSFLRHEIPKWRFMSYKNIFLRLLLLIPANITSKKYSKLEVPENMKKIEQFNEYRKEFSGTYSEIMKRYGQVADHSILSKDAVALFP